MPTTIEPYAAWAGQALPTEAEWEFAARGGLEGTTFTWGDEHFPQGYGNTWQGRFPWENQLLDGYPRTSPVEKFPPEWLRALRHGWERVGADERFFTPKHGEVEHACCAPRNPRVDEIDPSRPESGSLDT